MLKSLRKKYFYSVFVCCFAFANIFGQTGKVASWVNVTPNRYAPEFYSEELSLKTTLVDLPGAAIEGSTWTLSYEIYLLPEGEKRELAAKRGGRLGAETNTDDFPNRIQLVKGGFTKKSLGTLPDRTVISERFKFAPKISARLQMENADLFTVYSMKIYDAKLKKSLVKNGLFFGRVFVGDKQKRERMYLNFYVTSTGELFYSQVEKEDSSTEWNLF